MLVHQHRKLGGRTLNPWPSRCGPLRLQGDGHQFEVLVPILLVEMLPPGQLFAAASPRTPDKQQHPLAA
ncbi:MAG TPA: hypothetical protein VLA19_26140 [Herpetosiphonaceae bacterium]|nr:hypothetical protein [Herpetosiphonaceae bacterium]